jgi:uncharacterized protein
MKAFFTLLFIFSACVFTQAQQDKKTTSVKISTLPFTPEWDGVPEKFEVKGDGITFTAGKETDLYCFVDGTYYVNKVPKLLFKPTTDFIFSARIKPDFKNIYDGGAILLYSDEGNWAKVLLEKNEDGTIGLGASLVKDKKGDDSYFALNATEIYAKVVKSDKIFCFYYSTDGKTWKLLRTFPYEKMENLRIGFYAQSPKGPGCTVQFLDIKYRAEKFKDFSTGE